MPDLMGSVDYEPYKHLVGEYVFPPMGWQFAVSFEDGRLKVDRLFIQESKRNKFELSLVSDNNTTLVLACTVCDSTYIFHKESEGDIRKVDYQFDTLSLLYEKCLAGAGDG